MWPLPTELILSILDYLGPDELLKCLITSPPLFALLSSRHLEKRDKKGRTMLHLAVPENHPELLRVLLCHQAIDPNVKDNYEYTLLLSAIAYSRVESVQLLLDHGGVDINVRTSYGTTPLYHALVWGKNELLEVLLRQERLDVNARGEGGRTALSLAMSGGDYVNLNMNNIALLLEREDLCADLPDQNGRTPLSWAAEYGELEAVKLLLQREDVDASSVDHDGLTPLQHAAGDVDSGYADDELFIALMDRTGVTEVTRYFDGHAQSWRPLSPT
ncbi:ankyrin repeat domain-containing protein [Aspergillus clavatus NRRL 1]|uniref:Ankyrin repeat protein n=1 Tax=Aspergillus clavatus (strain ATCC 1007 / CBS 513.65 / DSM 816 / NCTC 3887 / NRRL 1 / QM 1276 / 107) TaxID=344612 RepID=A1C8G7_ASPCL|nr:Ankyrin repeat protein [Aspergillus clavatus NRRL 1]EAW13604.1 Ankyrin repeat protein [Aspergillus clavatus NRRL 1]